MQELPKKTFFSKPLPQSPVSDESADTVSNATVLDPMFSNTADSNTADSNRPVSNAAVPYGKKSTPQRFGKNSSQAGSQAKINFCQFPSLFSMDDEEDDCVKDETTPKKASAPVKQTVPHKKAQNIPKNRSAKATQSPTPQPVSVPNRNAAQGTGKPRAAANPAPMIGGRKYASLASFVEGHSNRLAKTAAQLAILTPGKMNPIYIYGGTSLGKTHLLEGIYTEFRKQKGNKPPLYMTGEQFTSSFIESLRLGTASFRNKFRGISALLIDDITFLIGKNSTQTELLHLIESLKTQGVQLVFTGDRPLKDFTGFRAEFVARLEAGMVCEIQPPEREILLTIFQRMVEERKVPISNEVCQFVVSRLHSHARQLSGALNRLHATYLATGQPITIAVAQEVLNDLIRSNRKAVRLGDIEKVVCETFGIGEKSLQSKSRAKQIAHPRMLAMWLARKYTRSALSEIGQYFGGRTHSTVVSAQKKIDSWLNENASIDCFDQSCPISDVIQKVERTIQAG